MLPYTAVALYINLLTSISNCYYYCREIHRKAVSQLSLTTEIILPTFLPILIDLPLWLICTNLSQFFMSSLATRLVGFNWNLLHLFHFDDAMQ